MIDLHAAGRRPALVVTMALLGAAAVPLTVTGDSGVEATLVDRAGNTYEVSRLLYQGQSEFEYYVVADVRRVPLSQLARLVLTGEPGDEELGVTVTFTNGTRESGTVMGKAPAAQSGVGQGLAGPCFTGSGELGPIYLALSDVREVHFERRQGQEADGPAPGLGASVITAHGERFEVRDLRYLGSTRFGFDQGPQRRTVAMERIGSIELSGSPEGKERREVTVRLWSDRTLVGTIAVDLPRLPGETDRVYYTRTGAALTGTTSGGAFAIGLRDVSQVRFKPVTAAGDTAARQGVDEEPAAAEAASED